MTKRLFTRVRSHTEHQRDERREQRLRMDRERLARQRRVDARTPQETADLIAIYRDAKARRIEAGKPVLPTVDEWRVGRTYEPVVHLTGIC